jgi:aspartate/methionine/tyrosine aminotransferase
MNGAIVNESVISQAKGNREFRRWHPSALQEWAKSGDAVGMFNLAHSGVPSIADLNEIPGGPFIPHLHGTNYFGHEGLKATVADLYGVESSHVLLAQGASQCNFLMAGAALAAGGTAIVETPIYEPILHAVDVWADKTIRLPRRKVDGFQPDPDEFKSLLTAETRLIVLTNLHNPSHVALEPDRLTAIVKVASRVGAAVMIDEVFLPMIERDHRRHGHSCGAISINSLDKAWGLDSLRVGWAVGPKDLINSAFRLNNLLGVNQPFITEDLGHLILQRPEAVEYLVLRAARAAVNRDLFAEFLQQTPQVSCVKPSGGISALVHLPTGTNDALFARKLLHEQDTVVFPGHLFECPGTIRVSFGEQRETVREGLHRLHQFIQAQL